MLNTREITSKLSKELPRLRREHGVEELFLFGSAARGEATQQSDIDILVRFSPRSVVTLFTLSALLTSLETLLGCTVDLVEDHPRLHPRFRARIEKDLLRVA